VSQAANSMVEVLDQVIDESGGRENSGTTCQTGLPSRLMSCSRPEPGSQRSRRAFRQSSTIRRSSRAACRGPNAPSGVNHQAPIALGDSHCRVEFARTPSRSLHAAGRCDAEGAAARRREGKLKMLRSAILRAILVFGPTLADQPRLTTWTVRLLAWPAGYASG